MKKFAVMLIVLLCLPLCALADAPEVTFSLQSGFYQESIPLEMHCDSRKATIYYTLDGSLPDENSLVYDGALSLGPSNDREDVLTKITGITAGETFVPVIDFPTGHIVRAVAITNKGERSAVVSGTYLIGYDREKLYGDTAVMFLAGHLRHRANL